MQADWETIRWLCGGALGVAFSVVAYLFLQLHRRVDKVDDRVTEGEAEQKKDRHTFRGEVQNLLASETVLRMTADREIETRLSTQVSHVLAVMKTFHDEAMRGISEIRTAMLNSKD